MPVSLWGDGPWTPLHAGEAGGKGEKRELREGEKRWIGRKLGRRDP